MKCICSPCLRVFSYCYFTLHQPPPSPRPTPAHTQQQRQQLYPFRWMKVRIPCHYWNNKESVQRRFFYGYFLFLLLSLTFWTKWLTYVYSKLFFRMHVYILKGKGVGTFDFFFSGRHFSRPALCLANPKPFLNFNLPKLGNFLRGNPREHLFL